MKAQAVVSTLLESREDELKDFALSMPTKRSFQDVLDVVQDWPELFNVVDTSTNPTLHFVQKFPATEEGWPPLTWQFLLIWYQGHTSKRADSRTFYTFLQVGEDDEYWETIRWLDAEEPELYAKVQSFMDDLTSRFEVKLDAASIDFYRDPAPRYAFLPRQD